MCVRYCLLFWVVEFGMIGFSCFRSWLIFWLRGIWTSRRSCQRMDLSKSRCFRITILPDSHDQVPLFQSPSQILPIVSSTFPQPIMANSVVAISWLDRLLDRFSKSIPTHGTKKNIASAYGQQSPSSRSIQHFILSVNGVSSHDAFSQGIWCAIETRVTDSVYSRLPLYSEVASQVQLFGIGCSISIEIHHLQYNIHYISKYDLKELSFSLLKHGILTELFVK